MKAKLSDSDDLEKHAIKILQCRNGKSISKRKIYHELGITEKRGRHVLFAITMKYLVYEDSFGNIGLLM